MMNNHSHDTAKRAHTNHYKRLLAMTGLSFVAMYVLMYAMVNRVDNALGNLNQIYMAGLMTSSMVVIELALMGSMYDNKRRNALIVSVATAALIAFWIFTRQQTAISDKQFLRSMIPHHGGAILMCQRAPIGDADIKRLCQGIIASQQAEIDQMKSKLRDLRR
ncbi:MAG: DUF305 domain-containing protein [Gemmatimonadaceae bacterium]